MKKKLYPIGGEGIFFLTITIFFIIGSIYMFIEGISKDNIKLIIDSIFVLVSTIFLFIFPYFTYISVNNERIFVASNLLLNKVQYKIIINVSDIIKIDYARTTSPSPFYGYRGIDFMILTTRNGTNNRIVINKYSKRSVLWLEKYILDNSNAVKVRNIIDIDIRILK